MKARLLSESVISRRAVSILAVLFSWALALAEQNFALADVPDAPDLEFSTPVAKKFTKTIKRLVQGIEYLGGQPPKLVAIVPTGEVEKDGRTLYKLKLVFRRVSRDRGDRKFPILKAKNYASALAHLSLISPGVASTLVTTLPKSYFGGRAFPTLFCEVDYQLFHRAEGDTYFSYNYKPVRRPHPNSKLKKKLIVEVLGTALAPGNYEVKIKGDAELDSSHPWVTFYKLVGWVAWAAAPIEVSLVSVLGTPDDLIINTTKEVATSMLLETESVSQISVLAKVPKVVGKNRAVAQRELEKRSLQVQFKSVFSSDPKKAGKVKSVSPDEGQWLKAGTVVTLTHFALSGGPVEPPPPVAPGDKFAAWIRPDRLTCCTTPGGILTYAYQGGVQSTMPANGILLQGGFNTEADLISWVCGRSVYYHFWAKNWASINGYTVSQLPCAINS